MSSSNRRPKEMEKDLQACPIEVANVISTVAYWQAHQTNVQIGDINKQACSPNGTRGGNGYFAAHHE